MREYTFGRPEYHGSGTTLVRPSALFHAERNGRGRARLSLRAAA
jgi:hypothetical protein